MTTAHRRAAGPHHGAARATPSPRAEDPFSVLSSRLHDHMLRFHGRTGWDLNGLPLADLHHFEHVEQTMGLNDLSHQHPAAVGGRTGVSPPEAAGPRRSG